MLTRSCGFPSRSASDCFYTVFAEPPREPAVPQGAEVRFGDGQSYVAERIEANYATYTVRSYFGRLQQDQKANAK